MGKGFQTIKKYPKLTAMCMTYALSCFFFMVQTPPKQLVLQERNLMSLYTDHAPGRGVAVLNGTLQTTRSKGLKLNSRKHLLNPAHKIDTRIEDDNVEDKAGYRLQCNMSNYLSLNKHTCETTLNKGNYSKGKNSVLKDANNKALRRLGGSIQTLGDVFKPREDNCNIDKVSQNCDWLRRSYMYGKETVTDEEKLFPLAFAMKIHKSADQAHRLLRYIYREHNIYCIHVDKKAPVEIYNQFKRIDSCFGNIKVIDGRINVVYSTIRQVEAELKCMNALSKTKEAWKYYINLTGQEFMLKTNLEIVKILRLMNGTNDIESYPIPPTQFHRFKRKTVIMNNFPLVTKQKKEPFRHNIEMQKGSAYGLFCREFVDYVLRDSFVKEFLVWLSDTYAPEESVWATLQMLPGTPGGRPKVPVSRSPAYISRAVKWQWDTSVTCHGKHVHWICIYALGDISWLLSNTNIVANKFYEDYEPLALECVEKKMYERVMNDGVENGFNIEVYRKLLHL